MRSVDSSGKREARDWKGDLIPPVSLLLFALLLIYPAVLRPTWWLWRPEAPHSDLAVTHWPNAHFTRRMVWEEGRFPLWRPTIMSGTPFAANPLSGLYYPPNWPLLFTPWLPLEIGFNLSALLHLWLAGVTMVALMRQGFKTGIWGALVAAVAYAASPKLLAHLGAGHIGWVQAWAWLPLVALCILKASRSASRHPWRWAVGGGLVLAAQFCADVRMSAYTLAAAATLALARLVGHLIERVRNSTYGGLQDLGAQIADLRFAGGSLALFLGLSACQWIPAVALLPETTRATLTVQDGAVWSLPWRHLAGLLVADHGGFQEWMTYLGVGTLVFACAGARSPWRARDRRVESATPSRQGWLGVWLIGLTIFAAWFSLGRNGGLFQVLWHIVPGLGLLRVPPRAWVLVVFATAALAGFGVEGMITGGNKTGGSGRWKRALTFGCAALPPMLVAGYWTTIGRPPLNLAMFGMVTPLAVALYSARLAGRTARWPGVAAVLLVSGDLLVVDITLIEARPPERVFEDGRAAAAWLADQPGRFRIYSPSYSIPQHLAERYGLELADGVDPLQLRAYTSYLTRAAGLESPQGYSVTLPPFPEGSEIWTALKDVCPDAERLGRLGVRYAAAAFPIHCGQQGTDDGWQLVDRFDGTYVYQNKDAEPVPDTRSDMITKLADGSELFRYDPRPVYAGWGVSGATLLGVGAWVVARQKQRETDD
jgi:hypothetical protein